MLKTSLGQQIPLAAFAAAIPLASASSQAAEAWRSRIARVVKDTVLANGLTVIIAENHAVPLATVKVSFRGGAAMQGPGEEGLAHLAEHYLFRTYGEDNAFAGEVATLNGTYNGTTSDEEVNYFMTIPSREMANGVRVIAKLVREPKLNDRALTAEKKVVADELARDRSDGQSALRFEMGARLWGGDWFRKNVAGTEQSINAIKMDRIRTMLATQYVPRNAAVIVSGDVNTQAALAEVIRRFGDWTAADAVAQPIAPTALDASTTFAVSAPDVHLVTLAIQWPGPSVTSSPPEAMAGEVYAKVLGSAISPAGNRLVASGPFHSFGTSFDVLSHRGAFSITATISPDAIDRGLAAMKAELDLLASPDLLNDSLLAAAKHRLRVEAEYSLESGVVLAGAIGATWAAAGLDYYRNYGDALDAVTLPAVDAFVKKYLAGKPYVAGLLAPAAQLDRMRIAVGTTLGRKTP